MSAEIIAIAMVEPLWHRMKYRAGRFVKSLDAGILTT